MKEDSKMQENKVKKNKKVGEFPNLEEFEKYLKGRNVSTHTIRAYLGSLRQFFQMFPEPNADTPEQYRKFLIENYKPRTVNLRICALNSYTAFLQNSSEKIPLIPIEKTLFPQNMISQEEYEYFKKCLLRDDRMLYYFAVSLMAGAGMRGSELIKIQVSDIKRGYLFMNEPDKMKRRIYIPTKLQNEFLEWLQEIDRTDGYVFLNRFGNPITTTGLREQLKSYARSYGINPSVVHPLAFRHLFIQNFVQRCNDIAALSQILGHENIDSTLVYLRQYHGHYKQVLDSIMDW